jgi:hypothetical protein
MKDKERWQMKLRKEAVEIKGARESSENDGGGQNCDKQIKASIPKTRS